MIPSETNNFTSRGIDPEILKKHRYLKVFGSKKNKGHE
jgi:hypothetical protein